MPYIPTKMYGQRFRSFTLILLIGLFLGLGYVVYKENFVSKNAPSQTEPISASNESKTTPQEPSQQNNQIEKPEETKNVSTYKNTVAGFELEYPEAWKIINTGTTSISLSTANIEDPSELDDKNILITFAYLPIMGEKPSSLSSWVAQNNTRLLSGTIINNKKDASIGNKEAICEEIDSRNKEAGTGGILNVCYVFKDDKIISWSYLAKNEEAAQTYKDEFEKIIGSVKFIQ